MVDTSREFKQILEAFGIAGEIYALGVPVPEEVQLVEYDNGIVVPTLQWFIVEGETIDRPVGPYLTREAADEDYQRRAETYRRYTSPYLQAPRIESFYRPTEGVVPRTELVQVGYVHDSRGVLVTLDQWEAGEVPEGLDGPNWEPVYTKVLPEEKRYDAVTDSWSG